MIAIPAGEIVLRDDRIKREWELKIDPFLMARFPVTQELYFSITNKAPSFFKGDKHPVEQVSWTEAVDFCNLMSRKSGLKECYSLNGSAGNVVCDLKANGYRLPLEGEWEYACKAGTSGARYGELEEIAWYKGNSQNGTHEVGTKSPNGWGLYDMLGNVWEWCSDIYDEEVYGSYRIFRGGGWCDQERGCLATNRRRSHPVSFKIDDLGFRLARSL
ncbi:formylglycine-generating enzyme family protein [Pedobacter caeni]|uniref:Formylglycine-generating enzyme, required for sulfatase activity, contains SUMF1/FGE domain n=1 Tax=Pedobacter caeni TaxID=288992 RepID=A0A1M5DYR8_9SPHI|nr:SUMF1/EgtB/PvdO family nonheme iron enzyme [Pedobacter caeni]SHF71981.1 Formylglycine-generating enzyme, required for sulfatase activity, contains SUMF1/FGE domain [Pedobacter caeni]